MVLQPALLCMQYADSASNIAARALIQIKTLYYCNILNFSSIFRKILTMFQTHADTYVTLFENVTSPFCVSSKKVANSLMQLAKSKTSAKIKEYCMW